MATQLSSCQEMSSFVPSEVRFQLAKNNGVALRLWEISKNRPETGSGGNFGFRRLNVGGSQQSSAGSPQSTPTSSRKTEISMRSIKTKD